MARLSASSSASNGHIQPPATTATAAEHVTFDECARVRKDREERKRYEGEDSPGDPSKDSYPVSSDPTLAPGGSRDLSFIGFQAFLLGNGFTGCLFLTFLLLYTNIAWWRLPAFLASLSIFHFLEYWTTARYNLPAVRASSFLLFSNGRAYTMAHTGALLEIIISEFFPKYQGLLAWRVTMAVGALMVVVCQVVRSVAMAQAGKSFNHQVAFEHKEDHVLVTSGLYAYFRHPSYFGYFWWAVGTQMMVGNKVCLVGFAIVLWRFFDSRIRGEEKYLVSFFGEKYEDYRKRVGTKIPFIR